MPQPGDVAIWTNTASGYGHVAIVTSRNATNFSVVEQNYEGAYCSIRTTCTTSSIWGVIRPDFTEEATPTAEPSYAYISTDKMNYAVDEAVSFSFNTDAAYGCNILWVYCPDGSALYYKNLCDTYTLKFGMAGYYEALVQAWNGVGSLCSARTSWYVGPPQYSNITINKNNFSSGETIYFTFNTAANGNHNTLWIYNPDGSSSYYEEVGSSYSMKLYNDGYYEALVQAWNHVGSLCSKTIKFSIGNYSVTYNANGGSGAPSSQAKLYGANLTLSGTKPTRTGYSFKGWNTNSAGTGTAYSAGGTYSANAAVALYAQWTAKSYTVSFKS